ncbi:hypothetical protein PsYK624_112220 [Phanerochaete sordida]|uniref:F-box domain-containing protein n=1 Tax=Phanerochaete sordida TaxID=48140 RepID=A0A9P3GFF8_9APHY|nr:hypothetical protein PsYK624_112220 [Phanerochaete sordida]
MFTALTRSPRLSTLSITVAACCEDRGLSYIPGTALLPLTRLSALTKLSVHSVHVDLQPADIAQLAAAWPHMQELGLANQFMYYGCPELDFHPSICIEDIYPFAERCPALRTLAVAVAGDIAPAVPCQNPRVARWSLRKLSLASSRFEEGEECARVAVFIREVFPAVCEEFHMLEEGAKSEIQELLL